MIETGLDSVMHKETSATVKRLLETVPDLIIENKLEDRLAEVGLNQKQFSQLTGLRHGTISEFVNGKKIMLNKYQLIAILIGLRLTDIKQIIDIKFPEEIVEQFSKEREEWIKGGLNSVPKDLESHYIRSLEK